MLLVCSVCGTRMRCQEIGLFVKDSYAIHAIRQGDLYACGEGRCSSVIADFGEPFGEAEAPQLYLRVMAAIDTGLPYVSRKTLQERF